MRRAKYLRACGDERVPGPRRCGFEHRVLDGVFCVDGRRGGSTESQNDLDIADILNLIELLVDDEDTVAAGHASNLQDAGVLARGFHGGSDGHVQSLV